MSAILPAAAHQHHAEILPHVDALRIIADDLSSPDAADLPERLRAEVAFLYAQLVPHMEMAEQRLYPRLAQLLQDSHALEPLHREHAEVRRLIDQIDATAARLIVPVAPGPRLQLRRALYHLYAILSVHLAEEEEYLPVLSHNLSEPELEEIATSMRHARFEPL